MHVLVVENVQRTADRVRRGLAEEGYVVDVATDGPEAIWSVGEWTYDAIVLDVTLPRCDGFEVCRRLRTTECWAPVLMLTARNDLLGRVRGLDAGGDDCLTKPFSFAELTARLRALIRRGAVSRPTVLEVGGLRLDPATRRAWRDDSELSLTAKEFALLELFLRRPGYVLTRTAILEQVWDFTFAGTSNVVDQYVAYLRRKIDHPFGCSDLQTLRGVGYRLQVSGGQPPNRFRAGSRC